MKMFNHQADVNEVTPMPVDRVDDASTVTAVAAEALTWFFVDSLVWASATGEAAGTIVTGKLDFSGQLNSMTSSLGSTYDTSFSLGAATRFDSRVEIPEEIVSKMQFMSPTDQAATAGDYLTTNGEYYVDHRRGQVWGIAKAIVANDAASYSYGAPVVGSGGPTSNVNLDKVGGTAVTLGQKAAAASIPVTIASDSALETPTTLTGGAKDVTTGGTAEALGTTLATKSIYIRAKSANTNDVYVGDSTVDKTTSQQIILSANDSVTLDISNRMTVYVDAHTNGEGVDYLAMS